MPIPTRIKDALLAGGVNLSFGFYGQWDSYAAQRAEHRADLPAIYALGARHVRLVTSMDNFEDGDTGTVHSGRFAEYVDFVRTAKSAGLVSIVDNHCANLLIPGTGDWETGDYMGGLRDPAVRARHLSLMTDLAARLYQEKDLEGWYVIQVANEPVFDGFGGRGNKSIWYEHQKRVIPAVRVANPTATLFVMAVDWQGIEATMNDFPLNAPFWDDNMAYDVHWYEPVTFTHSKNTTRKYPGVIDTWRADDFDDNPSDNKETWDRASMHNLIAPLKAWADRHGSPFIHVSEFGTDKHIDGESRLRYITDCVAIFRELGFGYTLYTWSTGGGNDFDVRPAKTDSRITAAAFTPSAEPPPDPPPPPPPVDPPPPPAPPTAITLSDADVKRIADAVFERMLTYLQAALTKPQPLSPVNP